MAADVNLMSEAPLVGMDDRVHLDSAFFLPGLGMPSDALENQVGEERDGSGVYCLEPIHPFRRLAASAVRRKHLPVSAVQLAACLLENVFRASLVGVRQRAAPDFERQAEVAQFTRLCKQGCGCLPQRVEPHDYGIRHHHQMDPYVEAFCVTLSAVLPADLNDF